MNAPKNVTLSEFTLAFVPLSVLLLWSMWQPELGGDLDLGRTRLTIWATTILLAVALVFYLFRSLGQGTANLAALYWTAAWLAFLIHAYFAVFVIFGGIEETFEGQGQVVAGGNFALLAVWTLDVVLLWLLPERFQITVFAAFARLAAFGVFAATLLVLIAGHVVPLGIAFVAVVLVGVLVRLGVGVGDNPSEVPS
ncbi:MAG: hypothetical protein AAGF49_09375 [Pseudomonadota bacterium]